VKAGDISAQNILDIDEKIENKCPGDQGMDKADKSTPAKTVRWVKSTPIALPKRLAKGVNCNSPLALPMTVNRREKVQ
jgi:hypothetical protein